MTTPDLTITGDSEDAGAGVRAIIDTATLAAQTQVLSDTGFAVVHTPAGGESMVVDLDRLALDRALESERRGVGPGPMRKRGSIALHTGEAFAAYVNRHTGDDVEVFADVFTNTVTAVLNGGKATADGGQAGWGDHRASYTAKRTLAWAAWLELHNKGLVPQRTFAEFIEDHLAEIADPPSADMLELAQTFEASLGGEFESSQRLSTGERQLVWRETVEARAGSGGALVIPKEMVIAVSPFEGSEEVGVQARFRFKIDNGSLLLGVRLNRPDVVEREAFDGVVTTIADSLSPEVPVLSGAAPAAVTVVT